MIRAAGLSILILVTLCVGLVSGQPVFSFDQLNTEIEADLPSGGRPAIAERSLRNVLSDIVAVINTTTSERTILNNQISTLIPDCPTATTIARANCIIAINLRTVMHAMNAAMHGPANIDGEIESALASSQQGGITALEVRAILHAMVSQIFGNIVTVMNEVPGPMAFLLDNPSYSGGVGLVYSCVTNYYVSSATGNDSNSGSSVAPWATIQRADLSARSPGDCINVVPGTYTWTNTYKPTQSGNLASPTGYVTYRCMMLNQCFIVFNGAGGTNGVWGLTVPYIVIDGFDIDGGETANFGGLAKTCLDSSPGDQGGATHHAWVLNNKIHGCGLSGFGYASAEYWFAIHNEVYDNAWTSQFQGSGIGFVIPKVLGASGSLYGPYTQTAQDLGYLPYHNLIMWNKVHENSEVTTFGAAATFTTTCNTHGNQTLDGCASTGTTSAFTASITGTVMNVTNVSTGALAVGQVIKGATTSTDVLQGTAITSFGTGAGGIGTYNVSTFQNTTSRTMTGATIAQLSFVACGNGANANLLPLTYVNTIVGGTITLTRPAKTTANGVSCTFMSLANGHTDGNGIILDTFCQAPYPTCYPFKTLVAFNDSQFNGGRGIHIFTTEFADVVNNSTYHNGVDIVFQGLIAELSIGAVNNNVVNNVAYATDTINPYCLVVVISVHCTQTITAGDNGEIGVNTFFNNVLFGGGGLALFNQDLNFYDPANNRGNNDPLYVDETSLVAGNLALQSGSPALNYFKQEYFLPSNTNAAGAYQAPQPGTIGCPQASVFLARTLLTGNDVTNYTNFICGLTSDGVITGSLSGATGCGSKLDFLYMSAAPDATTALMNICGTAYTGIANGSPAFTAYQGYTGVDSSTTVYIDTQFNPSTANGNYATNSAHVSAWSLTNVTSSGSGGAIIGNITNGGTTRIIPKYVNGFAFWDINDLQTDIGAMNASSAGFYLANRVDPTDRQAYLNAGLANTFSSTSLFSPNSDIFLLALDSLGSGTFGSANQLAMASGGGGLSSADIGNLCRRVSLYLVAVGAIAANAC